MIKNVEDIFKKIPFIYEIDNVLYALGKDVCAVVDSATSVSSRYNEYKELHSCGNDSELREVAMNLRSIAKAYEDDMLKRHRIDKEKFLMDLTDSDKKQLLEQFSKYIEIVC